MQRSEKCTVFTDRTCERVGSCQTATEFHVKHFCHSLDARYMTMPGVLQQKTYREYHSTDIVISLLYK